jgi:hypothetical protein
MHLRLSHQGQSYRWEGGVSVPALLWALPAILDRYGRVDYDLTKGVPVQPSFWAASVKDGPLDIEMPTHSEAGLRSLRDEAARAWDMALHQMEDRSDWLRLMGAARIISDSLFLPFTQLGVTIWVPKDNLETLFTDLIQSPFPETRLMGYLLARDTKVKLPEPPEWIRQRL